MRGKEESKVQARTPRPTSDREAIIDMSLLAVVAGRACLARIHA